MDPIEGRRKSWPYSLINLQSKEIEANIYNSDKEREELIEQVSDASTFYLSQYHQIVAKTVKMLLLLFF